MLQVRSKQIVIFLHSESNVNSFLLCGQVAVVVMFPGILAVLATAAYSYLW
jgi:hypothetical protein